MTAPILAAEITTEPIDVPALFARLGSPADGAAILFEGRIRERNEGRSVAALHYEAYAEMGREEIVAILDEALARFPVTSVGAIHRSGSLEIGDVSVAVVVAAPHRDEAYAASRYIIEEIKRRLPMWKKEEYRDGTTRWLAGGTVPEPGGGGAEAVGGAS